jgi:hypothetical protein
MFSEQRPHTLRQGHKQDERRLKPRWIQSSSSIDLHLPGYWLRMKRTTECQGKTTAWRGHQADPLRPTLFDEHGHAQQPRYRTVEVGLSSPGIGRDGRKSAWWPLDRAYQNFVGLMLAMPPHYDSAALF